MRTILRRLVSTGSSALAKNAQRATGPLDYPNAGAVGISQGDATPSSDRPNVKPTGLDFLHQAI